MRGEPKVRIRPIADLRNVPRTPLTCFLDIYEL